MEEQEKGNAVETQRLRIKELIESKGFLDMIQMPTNDFEVNGCRFRSDKELIKRKADSLKAKSIWMSDHDLYVNDYGLYVFELFERYPCFDSYDYAHEDRYYITYIISDSSEEARKKFEIINHLGRVASKIPSVLGPAVYYDTGIPLLTVSPQNDDKDNLMLDKIIDEILILDRLLEYQCTE